MSKVIVVTDSNSGITQSQSKELGVVVLPMPFYIDEKLYREGVDISREEFYEMLRKGGNIPAVTGECDAYVVSHAAGI